MSLQFIFGNSGSGKSYHLYHEIVREAAAHPDRNYLVLVPEQFTMQTQKDLCMAHPRGGIMNIDVLSFGRLAHRVFEELGRDGRPVLDDEGKNLVLRRIAGRCEEDLTVLKGNIRKQGYISEVKSVISEFTQYGVDFEQLDSFMEELERESYLYYKLRDIRKIYEEFEDFLRERYVTKEEMLDVLSEAVPDSNLLKGSVIALDGFTGFTPVQERLLGELLKVCGRMMVTVEMDRREDPFVYRHPYQLFALGKQMVAGLVRTAGEAGAEVEDPVYLWEKDRIPYRFRNRPQMAFLEAELFRNSGRQYPAARAAEAQPDGAGSGRTEARPDGAGSGSADEAAAPGKDGAVTLHEAGNPRGEVRFVAEAVRTLVRERGYHYRDIAVIAADLNVYADLLEKEFAAFDIPLFMDHKKSILLNAFVEYLRSLLAMAEQNFTYESVFRHLRTGMCGFTEDETDRLENYCLALGIRGYRKWQQAWVRQTAEAGEEELRALNRLRVRFVEKTDALMFVLKQRRKTVRDITMAVYEYLVQEKMQEQIAGLERQFQEEGALALAKEYSQVYRIVMDLFDKFAELLGDEPVSLKDYCDLLDAGLEEAKVGVIPPSLDQVVAGDVERTRIKHIRALFFVGANDTLLPGNTASGGILSERDREQFSAKEIALSPGPKEKLYIQKFYLYLNLTKPSEYLSLSWARTSGDGKTLRPAYLIQEIRRLFPGIPSEEEDRKPLAGQELTRRAGLKRIAEGIRDRQEGVDGSFKELYTWARGDEDSREALDRILAAAFLKKERKTLGEGAAEQLYGDRSRVSVTRLEQFASCAYAHFLSYGLRLTDREEYGFEALDLGNIAHQALERFSGKADRERLDWVDMTDRKREQLIDESVEESVIDYGNTVLFSSARNEYMISRIKKLLRRSVWALTKQLEKGDFVPSGYELRFGSGKIDRIDTCQDAQGVYVKVTDYKTGMKSFDITALYHGLQLQLPVYLNAAVEVEAGKHPDREIIPAGIFYYRIQDPVVPEEETDEAVENSLLKELRLDGLINAEPAVIDHLERGLSGTSVRFPMGRNRDGTLSKSSRALPPDTFGTVLRYAAKKERDMKEEMYSGEVSARPYELGDSTGCDYCPYHDICGFDPRISGYGFRKLEKYSLEEAAQRMDEAVRQEETAGEIRAEETGAGTEFPGGGEKSGEGDGDTWA